MKKFSKKKRTRNNSSYRKKKTSSRIKRVEKFMLGELKHYDVSIKLPVETSTNVVEDRFRSVNLFEGIKQGTGHNERIGNEILIRSIQCTVHATSEDTMRTVYSAIVKPNRPTTAPSAVQLTGIGEAGTLEVDSGVVNMPLDTSALFNHIWSYDKRHGWIASENINNYKVKDPVNGPHRHFVKFQRPMQVLFKDETPTNNAMHLISMITMGTQSLEEPLMISLRINYYDP